MNGSHQEMEFDLWLLSVKFQMQRHLICLFSYQNQTVLEFNSRVFLQVHKGKIV